MPICPQVYQNLISAFADDVLHVRVQTLGVTEHQFDIVMGGVLYHWMLYDVGGAVSPLPVSDYDEIAD